MWAGCFLRAHGVSIADFVRAVHTMLYRFLSFRPSDPACGQYLFINPATYTANSSFSQDAFQRTIDILAADPAELAGTFRDRLDGTWILDTSGLARHCTLTTRRAFAPRADLPVPEAMGLYPPAVAFSQNR
jgi:hypothetical protein